MPKTCASVISLTTLGKCNICFGLQNQLFLILGGMKQGNPTYTAQLFSSTPFFIRQTSDWEPKTVSQ